MCDECATETPKHVIRNQQVSGSSPLAGSIIPKEIVNSRPRQTGRSRPCAN